MTSLAALLVWLFQTPRWFQVAATARVVLNEAARILYDPAADRLRDLDEVELRALERALQTAEAGASLATWLLAHALAGRPDPRSWRPVREVPSRHPPTTFALARRANALFQRIESLHSTAKVLSRRLSYGATTGTNPIQRMRERHSPVFVLTSRHTRDFVSLLSLHANYSAIGRIGLSIGANFRSAGPSARIRQTGPPPLPSSTS